MSNSHAIVICGHSIFAHALESALVQAATVEVIRLHPHLPAIVERIVSLHPTLVLVECGDTYNDLAMSLLILGVPLVRLDVEAGQGTLLTGRPVALASRPDLDLLLGQLRGRPVDVETSLA